MKRCRSCSQVLTKFNKDKEDKTICISCVREHARCYYPKEKKQK